MQPLPNRSPAKRVRFGKGRKNPRSIWCSSDVAKGAGFDLSCGAGRRGLQHVPGMSPSALGPEPGLHMIKDTD